MTDEKPHITAYIVHTNINEDYSIIFKDELETNLNNSSQFQWSISVDNHHPVDKSWQNSINDHFKENSLILLMITPDIINSPHFDKNSFLISVSRAETEKRFIFPILLLPCDLSSWPELKSYMHFVPEGKQYGVPDTKETAYFDLIRYERGKIVPNNYRDEYMKNLTSTLETACSYYYSFHDSLNYPTSERLFKSVIKSEDLSHADIMGGGRRSRFNTDFYFERNSDKEILEHLKNGNSVLITGNPISGKTRALYEALKKLNDTIVLIPFFQWKDGISHKELNNLKERRIAVFDDLNEFLKSYGKSNLEQLIEELLKNGITVAATCRKGDELLELERLGETTRNIFSRVTMDPLNDHQYSEFCTYMASVVGQERVDRLDTRSYDTTIGSILMKLSSIRVRYKKLDERVARFPVKIPAELPREILRALKYFYYMDNMEGSRTFNIAKIKDFCRRRSLMNTTEISPISNEKNVQPIILKPLPLFTEEDWNNCLKLLSASEFELNLIEVNPPLVQIEDVYLERAIDYNFDILKIPLILQEIYKEDLHCLGFMKDVSQFGRILRGVNNLKDGLEILEKMKQNGIQPDIVIYNILIKKIIAYPEGEQLIERMKGEGLRPDMVTYNSLMKKVNSYIAGERLLTRIKEEGLKPDIVTYNTLLNKVNSYGAGERLLGLMTAENITPDYISFNTLMKKIGTYDEGVNLITRMSRENVKPDDVTYNTLMNKVYSFVEGMRLISRMMAEGIKPDKVTYNTLMNKIKSFDEGERLLTEMSLNGLKPDIMTYTTMLNKIDSYQDGKRILSRMIEEKIKPDAVAINTLIKLAANLTEALPVVDQMKSMGLHPDVFTYTTLLKKSTTPFEVKQLLDDMNTFGIRPNVVTYNQVLSKINRFANALIYWKEMRARHINPDEITVKTVSKMIYKSPRSSVEAILEHFSRDEISADRYLRQFIATACKLDSSCYRMVGSLAQL